MRTPCRRPVLLSVALGLPLLFALPAGAAPPAPAAGAEEVLRLPGLAASVVVTRDAYAVPTITATTEHDAIFALGVLHAKDRFFQMDSLRRLFSGKLATLLGPGALAGDIELRALGLDRAAAESLPALPPESVAWLEAYTEGVNAYLNAPGTKLPSEYTALELTRAGLAPWTVLDTLTVAKGLGFGLSFDLLDLGLTEALLAYVAAGSGQGFDGRALFSQDLFRTAPFDPTTILPPGRAGEGRPVVSPGQRAELPAYLNERTLGLIQRYRQAIAGVPVLRRALDRSGGGRGSNWWVAGGAVTTTGYPVLASDPHLDLDTPATFYEARLVVDAPGDAALDVVGVSFAGTPGIILGCNPKACWGATVNPMDVVDVYQEDIVLSLFPLGLYTVFDGHQEPITIIAQTFLVNQLGDGVPNNLSDAGIGPFDGGLTFVVPRRNHGPIISADFSNLFDISGLSLQYSGWRATREVEALRRFARAGTPAEFAAALQYFDFGSQNWSFIDRQGDIAYYSSAELPLREDLQLLGFPDGGVAPYFIRDGTHALHHEWLPLANPQEGQALAYEILPFAEMPQVVNPPRGYIVSANNDPVGNTLDNDPLNEVRPGGGVFYLNPGYATGFRAGRIQRLFDAALAGDGKVSPGELAGFQSNHQLLDAEVLVPYILTAFADAQAPDAPPELAALGADPGVAEAVGRLASWDFSTPTGIQPGYDPGDDPENLPQPSPAEIQASVAATVYSLWRGQVVRTVIDGTLATLGLAAYTPFSDQAMSALRNLLDNYDTQHGVGASGVDFFRVDGVDDPADERDVILLQALRDGLDLAASDTFAAAFHNSASQDDYRWGYLHRIVFAHPLGEPFSIPPAGGLDHLSPDLRGLARSGGMGAVDASSHDARAAGLDEFMFDAGPARRFIGHLRPGAAQLGEAIPGGESGVLGSPFQADQLRLWLTNHYHRLTVGTPAAPAVGGVLRLLPPP